MNSRFIPFQFAQKLGLVLRPLWSRQAGRNGNLNKPAQSPLGNAVLATGAPVCPYWRRLPGSGRALGGSALVGSSAGFAKERPQFVLGRFEAEPLAVGQPFSGPINVEIQHRHGRAKPIGLTLPAALR